MNFFNISGQSYQPVIHFDSTSWDVAYHELYGVEMTNLITKKHIDSLYSKLYLLNSFSDTAYMGKVREDYNSGQIWYVDTYGNDEKIIMDMDLMVGDTFQIISDTWSNVDSVYYQDERKTIRFDLQTKWEEPVKFIEGVGPNISLIYLIDDFDRHYVTCKYNADTLIYVNNNTNFTGCAPNPIGLPYKSKTENIKLYPNPATNKLHIELPKKFHHNAEFILRDVSGQKIKQQLIISNKQTISLYNINQGFYIVTIITNLHIYVQKIIITN